MFVSRGVLRLFSVLPCVSVDLRALLSGIAEACSYTASALIVLDDICMHKCILTAIMDARLDLGT